jgi:hypothetical protein
VFNDKVKLALGAILLAAAVACGSTGPAVGTSLTTSRLKFAVIDSVGPPAYCDPDFYPLAREGGEQASALARYDEIKADAETFGAITAHEHLPADQLSDAQKLTLYRAWKLLRALVLTQDGNLLSFQYRVKAPPAYSLVAGTVRVDGVVTVSSRATTGAPNCPICLAASTMIATPTGPVKVTDVRPGMLVWTSSADGTRVAAPVVETGSVEVPAGHLMVHVVLADGRELLASPGHRTADGRQLGTLARGDELDGSTITSWSLVPYAGERTYDLLPAGATGRYWANEIELSSTLASAR